MNTKKRSRTKNTWQRFLSWLTSEKVRRGLLVGVVLVLGAIFITWLLEYRYYLNDAGAAFGFISGHTAVFFYSALIIFTILLIFYGIFHKPFKSIAIGVALVLILGYINITKFGFRGVPLLPEDFQLSSQAGTLMKFVDTGDIVRLIIAVILTLVLGGILDRLTRKWLGKPKAKAKVTKADKASKDTTIKQMEIEKEPWWKKHCVIPRVVIVVMAVVAFLVTTDFVRNHPSDSTVRVDFLNTDLVDWSQLENYNQNGFLFGFLYNFGTLSTPTPSDYNEQEIARIKNNLVGVAEKTNLEEKRTSLESKDYNIIIVLAESFFDPEVIKDQYNYEGGDVTPNLHRLQNEVLSGEMFSPEYGGGTANVEYEVLTGLSNYWLKTVPYTNLLPKQNAVPSMASFAESNKMQAIAIHPFSDKVYSRNIVLPKMGFEEFITEPNFGHIDKEGASDYINDRSAYAQTLDELAAADKRQLISLMTMQNHAPYNTEEYGKPKFKVTNIENEAERNMVETYLMTLNRSDEYLGEFVEKIKNFEKPTVVLWYGDHSPGIFKRVLGDDNKDVAKQVRRTPYLIFSNFEFDKEAVQRVAEDSSDKMELPTTTPNCLSNTMLNILNLKKPLTDYLLDTICEETPTLANSYYGASSPEMSQALHQYQLLSYDLAAGEQYFLKD